MSRSKRFEASPSTDPVSTVETHRPVCGTEQNLATAALDSVATTVRPVEDLIADWVRDPEMRAELEARDAIRQYGLVEVTIRNVIVRGPVVQSKAAWMKVGGSGFTERFDNLDDARQFAEDHKSFFNNCSVRVSYLLGYRISIERVPAYGGSWTAPMVERDVTYAVWRDAPRWETGEPDRLIRGQVRETARYKTRYVVLGGPGGQMSMVPAGSPALTDRYAKWVRLAGVRVRGHVDHARLYRIYDAVRRVWELA